MVVLAGVSGGRDVVTHRGSHAGNLVGCHAAADARAVHHDAEVGDPGSHVARDQYCEVRVIDRLWCRRSSIVNAVSELTNPLDDLLLEGKPAVIASDGDPERSSRGSVTLLSVESGDRRGRVSADASGAVLRGRYAGLSKRSVRRRHAAQANAQLASHVERGGRDDGSAPIDRGQSFPNGTPDVAFGNQSAPGHAGNVRRGRRRRQTDRISVAPNVACQLRPRFAPLATAASLLQPGERIHRSALRPDLEMQVWIHVRIGAPYRSDYLSLDHLLPLPDVYPA
ncbi:MAG: hypothetical protein MNPFHGCM_00613 [Gemmatimonadaceae bacterium]|nr:hypothetical protein [Gemmatimonadaceae bacterium]